MRAATDRRAALAASEIRLYTITRKILAAKIAKCVPAARVKEGMANTAAPARDPADRDHYGSAADYAYAKLHAAIDAAVCAAGAVGDHELGTCAVHYELASARHESMYSRLYRS